MVKRAPYRIDSTNIETTETTSRAIAIATESTMQVGAGLKAVGLNICKSVQLNGIFMMVVIVEPEHDVQVQVPCLRDLGSRV